MTGAARCNRAVVPRLLRPEPTQAQRGRALREGRGSEAVSCHTDHAARSLGPEIAGLPFQRR
jgi:hypothetical protein